jgi:hypothetical protein
VLASTAFDVGITFVPPPGAAGSSAWAELTAYLNRTLMSVADAAAASIDADIARIRPACTGDTSELCATVVGWNAAAATAWRARLDAVFSFNFASSEEMDTYLSAQSYASSAKIGAAVVFNVLPAAGDEAGLLDYSLRLNYTDNGARSGAPGGGSPFAPPSLPLVCYTQDGCGARYVPPTNAVLNQQSKSMMADLTECANAKNPRGRCAQLSYANSGFLTLQQLVDEYFLDRDKAARAQGAVEPVPVSASLFPTVTATLRCVALLRCVAQHPAITA